LTQRKNNKTIANSFITRISPPNNTTGSAPYLGVSQQSIINTVKQGQMMEIRRCDGTTLVDIGCPCPVANAAATNGTLVLPGSVNWRQWAIGSIILRWDPPTVGTGPFSYIVTPYLNGVALTPVTTSNTEYRFTELDELKAYTFTVCATNAAGMGPVVKTVESIIMPPQDLSNMMNGTTGGNPNKCIKYMLNDVLNKMMTYSVTAGLGPTKSSRIMYLWTMSLVSAWSWVRPSEFVISGVHDSWNWSSKMSGAGLSDSDSVYWICAAIDYITPFFNPNYVSIYNFPSDKIAAVKQSGQWDNWVSAWQTWKTARSSDGSATAATTLPEASSNWNNTIVVDGTTINNIAGFPAPQEWTRLTVQGKKQGYLTWNWGSVLSTCLISTDDAAIKALIAPKTGADRNTEIDTIKTTAATLTDEQKSIAEFWAGGPKTPSPPCMYIWLWKEFIRNQSTFSTSKILYSLLDLSIHLFEGGRITWMLKKEYMEARPIQEIRRRFAGVTIQSWNGTIKGDQWIPYQEANFVTPPFADFPSGHSHFGKAFSLTMNKWFGTSIPNMNVTYDRLYTMSPMFGESQTGQYGSFVIAQGKSGVEPGVAPRAPVTLSWNTWEQMSESSGVSRFYGGIHAATAHTASKTTAEAVDAKINSTWSISAF
jgi:hypothetical protein